METYNEIQGDGSYIAKRKYTEGLNNLLINGGFEIWERGDSFATVNEDDYGADGWKLRDLNGGTPGDVDVIKVAGNLSEFAGRFVDNTSVIIKFSQDIDLDKLDRLAFEPLTFCIDAWTNGADADARIAIESVSGVKVISKDITLTSTPQRFAVSGIIDTAITDLFVSIIPRITPAETGDIVVDNAILVIGVFENVKFIEERSDISKNSAMAWYEKSSFHFENFLGFATPNTIASRIFFKTRKRTVPTITLSNTSNTNVASTSISNESVDGFVINIQPTATGQTIFDCDWEAESSI